MTSTNLIQQFFRQVDRQTPRVTSLQPGQIFYGKITKLFPNQMAEVQVGGQRMVAQLEVPLSTEERYWFQVQPGEGRVHLKVIANIDQADNMNRLNTPEDVIARLSLTQSREMTHLIRFMMKEQLPLTREMLINAEQWLKQVPNLANGLQVIKQVITKQLPITKDILSAFLAMRDQQPVSNLLTNLQEQLSINSLGQSAKSTEQLSSLLAKLTNLPQDQISVPTFRSLVSNWILGNEADQNSAFQILKMSGLFSTNARESAIFKQLLSTLPEHINQFEQLSVSSRQQFQLLQQLNVAIQANDDQQVNMIVARLLNTESPEAVQKILNSDNNTIIEQAVRTVLKNIVSQLTNLNENFTYQQSERQAEQFFNILTNGHQSFNKVIGNLSNLINAQQLSNHSVNSNINLPLLTGQDQALLQSIVSQFDDVIPKWDDKTYFLRTVTNIINSLGLNFENELQLSQRENITDTLKPLLLHYINDQPSPVGKALAEQLLHRLTGMQLFSQETGPLQQALMQVPIQMWDKTVDLTMQWSGQKTEDGKIDPNYCRVLFYLQLEHLDETIIDLQVQNRIMKITIYNEYPHLKTISEPFIEKLKENIEVSYYQLSAVTFKGFAADKQTNTNPLSFHVDSHYTGVDFRV